MIDISLLREKPEIVKESLQKRGEDITLVDKFTELDSRWRKIVGEVDALLEQRNKTVVDATSNKEELVNLKQQIEGLREESATLSKQRQDIYSAIPNIVSDDVPVGPGESANKPIKTVGEPALQEGLSHEDLMKKADLIDLESAAKSSGTRFRFLKNKAALAHLQLMMMGINHAVQKGFIPVIPPILAKEEILFQSGWFPQAKEDVFKTEDNLYLVGTSEPMLLALASEKSFSASELPLRFVGFSSCFRREAGSYGKDTKGMFRQHQFDKVEMVSICEPDKSKEEHEFMQSVVEEFIAKFNLPYQVTLIGSGDLGPSAAKKVDIETWFPSQSKYRETHSISNCTDYQARRLKTKKQGDNTFLHTLNGTLVTERLLLAIIENNQKPDGTIDWPEIFQN